MTIFIKDKIVINAIEWKEIKEDTSQEELSDYDKERLKLWTFCG